MLSKSFKVSTAMINFYLPLLVLICLNGRIYYEIKRRYKNVLLQRHSTKTNESSNHFKLTSTRKDSRVPISVAICDGDQPICATDVDHPENGNLLVSKTDERNSSKLRRNYKEKKNYSPALIRITDNPTSFADKNHCTQVRFSKVKSTVYVLSLLIQDELTWFTHHPRSLLSPTPILRPHRAGSKHRLNVDERCYKHTRDYQSCRIHSNEYDNHRRNSYQCYQTEGRRSTSSSLTPSRASLTCRRCSLVEAMTTTTITTNTTTMNIFNLCQCCSSATSAITIQSNLDSYTNPRKVSSSSAASLLSRKQNTITSFNKQRNNSSSSIIPPSNPLLMRHPSTKIRQPTVWNQQEKAFRQICGIVFGVAGCWLR